MHEDGDGFLWTKFIGGSNVNLKAQTMRMFPSTRSAWIDLFVFPFKAYILITLPIVVAFQGSTLAAALIESCGLCAIPLLLGLIVQLLVSTKASAVNTLFFFIPSVCVFLMFCFQQIQHQRFVENEKWKTQTYQIGFDEVVNRLKNIERQSDGKWHWDQKQEDKPSANILRQFHFTMNEHKPDEVNLVFEVFVAALDTNKTVVGEQTVKFGLHDTILNQEELITETNRIREVIKAISKN